MHGWAVTPGEKFNLLGRIDSTTTVQLLQLKRGLRQSRYGAGTAPHQPLFQVELYQIPYTHPLNSAPVWRFRGDYRQLLLVPVTLSPPGLWGRVPIRVDTVTLMTRKPLNSPNVIFPGDVVQDRANHKPLQVVDYELRDAEDVPVVWNSEVNQREFEVTPSEQVFQCVYLPQGDRVHIPQETHPFPRSRLRRVPAEAPSDADRVQVSVARSAVARMVADLRRRDHDSIADAVVTVAEETQSPQFARATSELADVLLAEDPSDD